MGELSKAERCLNPGNVKGSDKDPWRGTVTVDGAGFVLFEDLPSGCRAACRCVLEKYLGGKDDIRRIVQSWAPRDDGNSPEEYAAAVSALMEDYPIGHDLELAAPDGEILSMDRLLGLLRAIEVVEAGKAWAPTSDWLEGIGRCLRDFYGK